MNFKLENLAPGYIYEAMAKHIAERIASGELKPDTPLPAERRLAEDYGVSLGTARRATELLRDQNLVRTLRSKGTFVVGRRNEAQQAGSGQSQDQVTLLKLDDSSEHCREFDVVMDPGLSGRGCVTPPVRPVTRAEPGW